jgi:hypothetical protein
MSIEQYIESTKYLQWEDGMYVMLDSLECDYELALVENSLRDSRYFSKEIYFQSNSLDKAGIFMEVAGYWSSPTKLHLTREQALYIATGETTCTTS